MATDSLRKAVDEYDRKHNEPRVLRRLPRRGGWRLVCVTCRDPLLWESYLATFPTTCPACGGELVEVVS